MALKGHIPWNKGKQLTRICPNGHDKDLVGRTERGSCIECRRISLVNRKQANPSSFKNYSWKLQNILNQDSSQFTNIDYDRAYQIQQGRCANKACNKHQSELNKALAVDHDHETRVFRGLLCHNCNTALGLSYDDKETLKGLVDYLCN